MTVGGVCHVAIGKDPNVYSACSVALNRLGWLAGWLEEHRRNKQAPQCSLRHWHSTPTH